MITKYKKEEKNIIFISNIFNFAKLNDKITIKSLLSFMNCQTSNLNISYNNNASHFSKIFLA